MCFKAWEELAIPTYARQARYGPKAGQPNPRFLDAKHFNDSSSHVMSIDIPRKGWHFFQQQAFGQLSHHRQPKDDTEPLEFVLPRVFPTPNMALVVIS
jgi:hypothetical protein